MADLTITVPNDKVNRIRAAFGEWRVVGGLPTNEWVPATPAQLTTKLKDFVRQRVEEYERQEAERAAVDAERVRAQSETW